MLIKDEATRKKIVAMLTKAYWMEIETVMNYISESTNPDGVRAGEIKESLASDITKELGHAQAFAKRIKELYGIVPGSFDFKPEQKFLQPPKSSTDVVSVIKGVIEAEQGAIDFYTKMIDTCDGVDWVTQDMMIEMLKDEQGHMRMFEGFLKEYEEE